MSWLEPVFRFGYAEGDVPSGAMTMANGLVVRPMTIGHGSGDVDLGDEPLFELCGGASAYLRENVALRAAYVHNVETWSPTVRVSLAFGY